MPLRVLVVEDDPITALHIRSVLEGAGHTVVGAVKSVTEALGIAAKAKPQVAIVDMMLRGDPEGLEVAAALGAQYGVRILFLSGSDAFMVRAMALDVEALGYVLKPFEPDDILAPLSAFAR